MLLGFITGASVRRQAGIAALEAAISRKKSYGGSALTLLRLWLALL